MRASNCSHKYRAGCPVRHGLEEDPPAAIRRTIRLIDTMTAEAGVTDSFRLTAALTDGTRVYAIRHSTDDKPPCL